MLQSRQNSAKTAVALSLALILTACSSDPTSQRQVSGSDAYLNTTPLQELRAPEGMILPVQNGEYSIPPITGNGAVGKALDIRPPELALAVVSGSSVNSSAEQATLTLTDRDTAQVWQLVIESLTKAKFAIAERHNEEHRLVTDWISWQRGDEKQPFSARYEINVKQEKGVVVSSRLLALRQGEKESSDPKESERYNRLMLNTLGAALEKQQHQATAAADQAATSGLVVQSGSDETGLPLLILRASYATTWNRLPDALKKIGMEIEERNRAQGVISVNYVNPGSSTWQELSVNAPSLQDGEYQLQLGDLDNRSSLQFTNSQEQVLTQTQNDELVEVLQAALAK